MEIYNYDNNFMYIGSSVADESPLEKGVYLIPTNATTTKPPVSKDGFIIKFNIEDNSFVYVEEIINNVEQAPVATTDATVPNKISRLQAKLQLLEIGLLDEVEEMVKQDRVVQLYWNDVDNFYRTDTILLNVADILGLTSEQLDDLFIQASSR